MQVPEFVVMNTRTSSRVVEFDGSVLFSVDVFGSFQYVHLFRMAVSKYQNNS